METRIIRFLILWPTFCFGSLISLSSQVVSHQYRYFAVQGNYGKTAIHSKFVSNLNGSHPSGISLEIGQHYINDKTLNTFGCYPRIGLCFNYWNFDYGEVGWGLTGLMTFEPFILLRDRFMWSLKGGAGPGWLSNPYSENNNPENLAYSTHINFSLLAGMNFYKPINSRWMIKLCGSFQHISNGAIKHPNYGINASVLSFGVDYIPNGYNAPKRSYSEGMFLEKNERESRSELILGLGPKDISGRSFLMSLIQYRYVKQWTRINGWAAGVLGELDGSESAYFPDNSRLSALLGHEFFFGKAGFSQEIGWYVYNPTNNKSFHQLYSLHFKVLKHLRLGVNLKAHLNVAELLGCRIVYVL